MQNPVLVNKEDMCNIQFIRLDGDDNDDDVTCPPVFLVLLLLVSVTA